MGSNDTSMKIEYRITEDDYAAIARFNAWRRLIARPSTNQLVAGVLLVALSGIWLWKDSRVVPALACLVAIYLMFLAYRLLVAIPRLARRHYRNYKGIDGPIAAELTDAGVRFSHVDGEWILPWSKIFQWRQNDRFVIIYSMPVLFHIVPKSTAHEGFDIPRLVQLLAERVGPER
jgi:hypothetical protein